MGLLASFYISIFEIFIEKVEKKIEHTLASCSHLYFAVTQLDLLIDVGGARDVAELFRNFYWKFNGDSSLI